MLFPEKASAAEARDRLAWVPAAILLVASFLGTATLSLRPSDDAGAPVAAVFPPWWSAEHSFAAALSGGAIVRDGAWSNILVVKPEDRDAARRLYAAGAWLLLDPKALAACLKEKT
jgi:hypothetical protein